MRNKLLALSLLFALTAGSALGQVAYSPVVDSLIQLTTEESLSLLNRQLSGDTSVTIDGGPYTIASRSSYSEGNPMAAQWIYEQLEELGYTTQYHSYSSTGTNVVATKTGSDYPEQEYIICAHYDDMPEGPLAPGADDNASGVCGVLEAARLMKNMDIPYTVKFIAFDEEEYGLIGSWAYAEEAANNNDDILGVINLDMIAWDSDGDLEYSVSSNDMSNDLKDDFITTQKIYEPDMNGNIISTTASDHASFWYNDYPAILLIEDWGDFNDYYHTTQDVFSNINVPYFHKMSRVAIASFLSLAMDLKLEIIHDPLESSNNTDDRVASAVIQSSHEIGSGNKQPRLYYRVDGGQFDYVLPGDHFYDNYEFTIPGQPAGSQVDYYIAAQDEESLMVSTLPVGGKGIDPPGTIAPENMYSYFVADVQQLSICMEGSSKPVYDLENTLDTIVVYEDGYLLDLNVELEILHSFTGELEIYLLGPEGDQIPLSLNNGGSGDHYQTTIFDDEANTPITEGVAPFDGSYQPEEALSAFNDKPIDGNWVLKVYDSDQGNQGLLQDWCIHMEYTSDIISVDELPQPQARLEQNYPNPVVNSTTIQYEVHQPQHIRLEVFDMYGHKVKVLEDSRKNAGKHILRFSVNSLKAGQYFYRLSTERDIFVKSFMVIR